MTYDICDPKRLRRTFKVLEDYGDHLQLSVFECLLNRSERIQLEDELRNVIHHDDDQVLFLDLGPADGDQSSTITSLGIPYVCRTIRAVVV